jgi:2-succinyl-6-hydroxy-2,4-cyclohexadiene-1-carboxylate synthase
MPFVGHQYYEEQGHGFPLVLIHGHTLDHRVWMDLTDELADRFRVITPDMAGHGRSGPAPEGATLAGDLAGLLTHLQIERAAICGLSMGGGAAISFALHCPERCAALIPVDAALFGYRFTEWSTKPYVTIARSQGLPAGLEAWLNDPLFAGAARVPGLAERLRAIVLEYPGYSWLGPVASPVPPGPPEADRLAEIAAPTLVIVGEHDLPDFQRQAALLAQQIPGARKAVVAESGHLVPVEQPDRFVALLTGFLNETLGV